MQIAATIFDMDGLIVDSEPLWKQAEKTVFSSLGIEVTEANQRETALLSTQAVTEYWFRKQPWQTITKRQAELAVVEEVNSLLSRQCEPKSGFFKTLELCLASNLKIALASNAPQRVCLTVLQNLDCLTHFDCVVSADRVLRPKPEPDIYLYTAAQLGVLPSRCLVFEDSPTGSKAAVDAGMRVIGVPFDPDYVEPMRQLVHQLVGSLDEVQHFELV